MRRSLFLLVVMTAALFGGGAAAVTGAGTAHACSCTEAASFGTPTAPVAVPDTTVADTEAASEEEDRTAGYVVMVVAVLVFVGGFAIIARRARSARDAAPR